MGSCSSQSRPQPRKGYSWAVLTVAGVCALSCTAKSELAVGADPEVVITAPGANASPPPAQRALSPAAIPKAPGPAAAGQTRTESRALRSKPAAAAADTASVLASPTSPGEPQALGDQGLPSGSVTRIKEPKPKPPPEFSVGASLVIKRVVVTHAVDGREPVDPRGVLTLGQPAIAFVEVESGPGAPHTIQVVFEHKSGRQVGFVELEIPPERSRWRTWGRTQRIAQPGRWTARVLDETGQELARADFEVEE